MPVTIAEFVVGDPPAAWEAAGFAVDDDVCRIGSVAVRLVGREQGSGIHGWSLRDVAPGVLDGDLDGLPTTTTDEPSAVGAAHPNGATHIDHVVLMSAHIARTVAAFEAIGVAPRRVRDFEVGGTAMQQVFFRLGEVIVELVGAPGATDDGPTHFWGLTHVVPDVDAAAVLLGPHAGRVKDAVQPGRRIVTLRHTDLGMSVATALISPAPRRGA